MGARHVVLSQQSFCPLRYKYPSSDPRYVCDIGFIGHFEKHYARTLSSLNRACSVSVWGDSWQRAANWRYPRWEHVKGPGAFGVDYVNALASFKIGLGLLSKFIPERHTTRSFEIPAAGTFLLAERTDEHQEFFIEGEEAEYFSSIDELTSKAEFYLRHPAVRARIAKRGHERCWRSGYDADSVLRRVLMEIK